MQFSQRPPMATYKETEVSFKHTQYPINPIFPFLVCGYTIYEKFTFSTL